MRKKFVTIMLALLIFVTAMPINTVAMDKCSVDLMIFDDMYRDWKVFETIEGYNGESIDLSQYVPEGSASYSKFIGWYKDPSYKEKITIYTFHDNDYTNFYDGCLYAGWNYEDEPQLSDTRRKAEYYEPHQVALNMLKTELDDGREAWFTYGAVTAYKDDVIDLSQYTPNWDHWTKYTAPWKDYLIFEGWYADEDLENKIDKVTIGTSDIGIYAGWIDLRVWNPYIDIDCTEDCDAAALTLSMFDIMKGTSEDRFDPNKPLTRAMAVTLLWRCEGYNVGESIEDAPIVSGTNTFSDVKPNMWYTNAVNWAVSMGIINGYGNGKFGVNDNLTTEQFCAMLHRYAKHIGINTEYTLIPGLYEGIYTDYDNITPWAKYAVDWALYKHLLELYNEPVGLSIMPNYSMLRCEAAYALWNMLKLKDMES